ncbi:MAG: hypothetical protein FJ015_07155 [Chloroflexi bacterium]|nr:hypothetical protein [Chloroflexota bacterium]
MAQNQNAEEKRRYNTVAADDRLYAILNTNKNRTTVGTGLKADGTVWVEISRDDKIVHQFELNAEE